MHSHTAIELLKTLNDDELRIFGDFIRSPYFNKREVLVRLFEIISKHAPEYKSSSLKKENLYKKLFPGKEYNEQTLRSRISEFSNLIKLFLSDINSRKDEFTQRKYLIEELTKRKKFELSEKYINEAIENLEKDPRSGQEYFMNKQKMLNEHITLWTATEQKNKSLYSAYERGELSLNHFFLDLLKIESDLICYEIETKIKPEFNYTRQFFEKFDFEGYIDILKEKDYKHYPIIAAYYYGNLSMMHPEEETYFFKLKELIYKYHSNFDLSELDNFWSLLSNCAYVNFLKKGNRFQNEVHEINKFFISKELYDKENPFSAIGYQNILINAMTAKDLDWGEKFVDDFKKKLAPEVVTNRYHYCKALISYERKNYEESIAHLNKVKPNFWDLKFSVRLIYLRNFYELGDGDQVSSLINSSRYFFSTNNENLPEYVTDRFKATINYISRLSNAKFSGKKLEYADLKEAENAADCYYKSWILEKFRELI